MIKFLLGIFAAALLTSGFSVLAAQETQRDFAGEPPRLTPEERREQWEQMRHLTPEQRQARLRELREKRGWSDDQEVETAEEPASPPPGDYLDRLEFRSLVTLDGVTEFSLHDPYEERTFLVSAEESRNGVEVVEFDAERSALTLRHEGETDILYQHRSRIAELDPSVADGNHEPSERQRMWEERRERFQRFREIWREAVEQSPELQQVQRQFHDLAGDYRENRTALRTAAEGSPEYNALRGQEREMREEFRLLSEYSLLEMKKNPEFAAEEVESLEGMMRGMMFRGDRGDRGDRGRGRGDWDRGQRRD